MTTQLSPTVAKACCATAYSSDAVALVLGESYHPGGLKLTRHLAELAGLQAGQRVLDIASGPGTTAMMLASEFGVSVDGVDLAHPTVLRATASAAGSKLSDRVAFLVGTRSGCRSRTPRSTRSSATAPSGRSPTNRRQRPRWLA